MTPRPLQVAYFVHNYLRLAGSQRSLLQLVRNLPRDKVTPLLIVPAEGPVAAAFRESGIEVLVAAGPPALHSFGGELLRLPKTDLARILATELVPYNVWLARRLRRRRVDILHANTPRGVLTIGLAARLAGARLVLHHRGQIPYGGIAWQAAQNLPDRIVVVANSLRREFGPRAQKRARTVYNAAPDVAFAEPRHVIDGPLRLLTMASLVPFKGVHHLLRAADLLRNDGIDFEWTVAGDRPDRDYAAEMEQLRSELRLSSVRFIGFHDQPLELLAGCDVVVLPTLEHETRVRLDGRREVVVGGEGLPRCILEAMAVGRPVVASNTQGVPEQIVNGETGWIVPASDPAELAGAIRSLARNPNLRCAMGNAGRALASTRFSVDALVDGVLGTYRELFPGRM